MVEAGLHPATGGDGIAACFDEMLLDALVAGAGVTLNAVSTAIRINLGSETEVRAEGDLDFRKTLGVDKEVPVGFKDVPLIFHLDTSAEQDQIDTLIKLTEQYVVVFQTLSNPPVTKREVISNLAE